ncbi:LOW QUALITY PROTEIN: androgen-induced gene 1 protein [Scomber japonicus]|uniref:LOW QUALITY PROTEIN: androgen-induced gene 1 protein n=1 Tax=Scomber japonicus TaxID=13676 RepID=UPI0023064DC8|nr:LOW QUALITY PROTEIN: androgen-induced gene 1 protein [Scomber japonicus]
MALIPSQVLRVAILLSYFSILCHYKALDMPAHQTYGGSWKFLTFIDLVIQAVFFGLCVLIDVSSLLTKGGDSREQERQLRKLIGLRDWMMAVLAFPVGAFVVFTFWSLYLYDRELVYPKLLDNFIPQWLNHGMNDIEEIEVPQIESTFKVVEPSVELRRRLPDTPRLVIQGNVPYAPFISYTLITFPYSADLHTHQQ